MFEYLLLLRCVLCAMTCEATAGVVQEVFRKRMLGYRGESLFSVAPRLKSSVHVTSKQRL